MVLRSVLDGFWTNPLPAATELHPQSATFVANLDYQIKRYYGAPAINTASNTAPVYLAQPDERLTTVRYSNCQLKGWTDPGFLRQLEQVPLPPAAVPARGSDGEMIIYQPSTDRVWEFWRAEKRTDGWYACWGGRLDNASKSQGIHQYPYGVTATGLSLLGGMIQHEEVVLGHIDHVIDIALPETRKKVYSWPANRTDGRVDKADAIPQGLRFRLDPSLDVEALTLHPVAKMMARAIQRYGIVVRDSSGAVSFYFQNPANLNMGNPYSASFAGTPTYSILKGFPWSRLQALPMHYGMP